MIPMKPRMSITTIIKLTKCFSTSTFLRKSHYDALGLTPHATQADIKSAYYKLSMEFHPDKNKGSEEAANKFRDITTAYEVLGNLRLRRLYDKGMLHTAGPQFAQQTHDSPGDETQSTFYKSREQRSRPPPPTGKTPIYNFDEWTQMHYGSSFARREAAKARYERKVRTSTSDRQFLYSEVIFITTIAILTFVGLGYTQVRNYDTVESENNLENSVVAPINSVTEVK
ncbi:dnaJ homolog subfamily C member 30, mitochondrial [Periplaneta americana]|uniref:dnaJ homolog subfamily C member 30, mitochondrial n=1 Tax=Periplaneta americana TaxID=6978 RepID=UPI0037E73929